MIKTPLSTVIGGAFWTPGATIIGSTSATFNQLIKSLFSDGTQGIYLNAQDALSVSDLSSIKDLSGNNNHALQANSTSRASLITDPSGYKSLKFDGIDDGYATQSINFTATDKVTVIAAVRKLSDTAVGMVAELSVSSFSTAGTFSLRAPQTAGAANVGSYSRGTVQVNPAASVFGLVAPVSVYLSAKMSISTNLNAIIVNGVTSSLPDNQGTGNYGNYPLYIGRRGGTTLPFNGQIYAILVIGKLLDDATTQRIEKEFAKYIGVTL